MNAKKQPELRAVLYVESGPAKGEAVKLRRDATIIGREKGDVVLPDSEVSSTHCQIQNINGVHHLFDMNSTNGTFLNKQRVVKAKLNDGDIINVGKSSFRFAMQEEAKVRSISTIFKSPKDSDFRTSVVDTLIESEVRGVKNAMIVLDVVYGDSSKERVELSQRSVYIGRASSFGKFEQDPEVSRKHLLIKLNDDGDLFVEDLGSTNGSFINGNKINGLILVRDSDVIKVGTSTLRISKKYIDK